MSLPPPAPSTAFHFAPLSHGPITAQWTASATKPHQSSGGINLFGRKQQHARSQSEPHQDVMYGAQQQFQQQQPFPAQSSSHGHGHTRSGAHRASDDEYERQLDYETDANTSYNAAKLSANIRPMALPAEGRGDKGKGKSKERGKESVSKARRRAIADQERRMRRRKEGIESDTTQGQDTDSDEYMTGFGTSSNKPLNGMLGAGQGYKPSPAQAAIPASSSMPNIPPPPQPTTAHPYISNTYTSPGNQYGHPQPQPQPQSNGYGYSAQPGYAGYGQQQQQPGGGSYSYAAQPGSGGTGAAGSQVPSSYFSPGAPASAGYPNLFAQTNPNRDPNHAMNLGGGQSEARYAAEVAAREKLRVNPLPGLPGTGGGGGNMPGFAGGGGMPALGRGGMPGLGGGMPGAGGMPGLGGMPRQNGGIPGAGGMPAMGLGGTLPGGYGQPSSREKSKSKGHVKAASTGTLPAQQQHNGYPQYAPARAAKTSDPPPPVPAKGRGRSSREKDRSRGRSSDRDKERSRSRSRSRPGWDTADGLLSHGPPGPNQDLRGIRDGAAILNGRDPRDGGILYGGHNGAQAMMNGVPVMNAGPSLERVPSRSKWGKITGLFTRGRRGSSASQQETYGAPPPLGGRERDATTVPPPVTKPKSGFRNLSFSRMGRGPPPPNDLPPRMTGADIGIPPGQVPVGIHVDRHGKIVDPPKEFMAKERSRAPAFRPGRGDEKVEGPIRLDAPGRRTSSDVGYTSSAIGMGGPAGMGMGMGMRRTSSDAPMPGFGIGMGPPPLGGHRPSMDGRRPSMEDRRPSMDGPDAYRPAMRHRAGSGSSQRPPPLTGTIGTNGIPGYGPDGLAGVRSPAMDMGMGPMKSPAGFGRQDSWDARSPGMGLLSPHTPQGMPSPHLPKGMPSPHVPKGTPRYGLDSILSPRMDEAATPYTQTARYEAAGATPYMRERDNMGTPRALSIATTVPRTLPRPRTADSAMMHMEPSPSATASPDVVEADVKRAEEHREAFEWAEQDAKERVANGDDNAPYIFNGFPTWVNWDLFTRLENLERRNERIAPLPRVTSVTRPEMLQEIYNQWHTTRDKWVDRFWDPRWARFMHETGGPIQKELAEERQTPMGRSLEAARVYQRENSELPLAKREFSRGYMWDSGYLHDDWQWIKEKPWRWTVEHENDERRATGRAPLPRYNPGMSHEDWRDVRDVWHTTASKWAEKRKDHEWVERDRLGGITPERRKQLEQQFLRSRQQHNVIRKASGQRSREALRPEERDKIRHDSAMELLARRQEAFKQAQVTGTPRISEAELARRRHAQQELDELMRTPAMTHRPASSIGHASTRRGEGSVRHGTSSVGHAGPSRDGWGGPTLDEDTSRYDSSSSEDLPPVINPYMQAPNGLPLAPAPEPLPEWMRRQKTSDPPSTGMQSIPSRNPPAPSVSKPKKSGILKGILKRTLSIQRGNNNNQNAPGRTNTQRQNGQPTQNSFAGMFGHGHSRSEVSPIDNPWAGVFRSAHPVSIQPIRFDRNHPFSMTSPHALDYEGKLYPSAIHLWHAMRFLRRPVGRGRGRTEESWHPELAEGIRQANEPELYADQWAHAGAIGKDGSIMRSLQRPDWEEVQMNKMDEVLALKFTQHPSLGRMLMSTHPAELLYMWDGPWGAGADLKGPNNLGKAVMRCRDRLMQHHGQ